MMKETWKIKERKKKKDTEDKAVSEGTLDLAVAIVWHSRRLFGRPALRMCRWSFGQALLYVLHFHLATAGNTFICVISVLQHCNNKKKKTHMDAPVNWYGSFFRLPVRCSEASSPACRDESMKETLVVPELNRPKRLLRDALYLCWLLSSSTDDLRSRSWFFSSSSVTGVRGECRSSGEGLKPEEEDGEAGRWLEVGGTRTDGLLSGALLSKAYG